MKMILAKQEGGGHLRKKLLTGGEVKIRRRGFR